MANEIVATIEENKVTKELLEDYLRTTHKELNDTQFKQFIAVTLAFGLNPWKNEVHPVVYKNKDGGYELSIVTGYEVYLKRAEMNPNYDGYEIAWKGGFKPGKIVKHSKSGDWEIPAILPDGEVSCTCTVYRKDRNHPISEEVFYDEYNQNNSMWQSKPRTMLKKVAIVSAFRKAFPIDFGGMPYVSEELPDTMTGADKLEQQGYTEVSHDELQQLQATAKPKAEKKPIDEATKQFMEGMKGLWTQAPKIYQSTMKEFGFKSANNVPPERRGEVFNTILAHINKAAQPQSAPTEPGQEYGGEVDNSLF